AFQARDYQTAFQEWLAAANGGDARAQFNLGKLYQEGLGVLRNFVEAHRWYNLAAAGGGSEAASARDRLSSKRTASQIADAERLASEWRPTPNGGSASGTASGSRSTRNAAGAIAQAQTPAIAAPTPTPNAGSASGTVSGSSSTSNAAG